MREKIKSFLEEDRGVSPVVGVALLIAIAVILAAVVGAVVLGLGTSSADAPQASLTFESDAGDNQVIISHEGGETLIADNIEVRGDDVTGDFNDDLSAGETTEIDVTDNEDGEITVVWLDPESDDEVIIGSDTFDVE